LRSLPLIPAGKCSSKNKKGISRLHFRSLPYGGTCGSKTGAVSFAQNPKPPGGSQAGYAKSYVAGIKKEHKHKTLRFSCHTELGDVPSFISFLYPAPLGAICLLPAVRFSHRRSPPLLSELNQAKDKNTLFVRLLFFVAKIHARKNKNLQYLFV